MNKIQRVSLFFRILFQIIFIATPIVLIFAWMNNPQSVHFFGGIINANLIPRSYITSPESHGGGILHTLSNSEKLFGFSLSLIPTVIYLYVVYSLIKLFKLYEINEIFSINNVRYLRHIGYALLIGQLVNPFYEAAMGVVLTMHNPPGHRYAAVSLDQTNLGMILMALFMILISWIMAEGCKLIEEQQLTI